MSKLLNIRAKLDKKLFSTQVLGSNVTVQALIESGSDFGGYSGTVETYGSAVSVIAVPYNKTTFGLNYQSFGDLEEGEIMMVFRYDTVIEKNYKVTFMSESFRVKEKKDIPLNDGIVAIICKLKKEANI